MQKYIDAENKGFFIEKKGMNRSWSKIKLQIQLISGSSIWEDMQKH